MKRHVIYLYWLLLLIPTVIVGVFAFIMLGHEKERLQQAESDLAQGKARLYADQISLAVENVQHALLEHLARIPPERLTVELERWDRENPLARNVFIWHPRRGLLRPNPRQPENREQFRFIMRYEPLFSGRVKWGTTLAQPEAASNVQKTVQQSIAPATPYRSGWAPWYSENHLHLLGWVQMKPGGIIHGVELEMMAFLSRLYAPAAGNPDSGNDRLELRNASLETVTLTDGAGNILHQSGPLDVVGQREAAGMVLVGPALPHWQVHFYRGPSGSGSSANSAFVLLAGLLVGTFLAAILLGGSLLLWQAHRHALEARQRTSFVSNVSHELKTPLTSIRMYAELLGEDRVTDPEKRGKYLAIITAESQRLGRLVNNVLDFSQLEQGRKKYHLEDLMLAELVSDVVDAQSLRLEAAGISVEQRLEAAGAITIRADRDALEQALINLIDNACKYAAAGKELVLELERHGPHCRLAVMDRGPGIDREHANKVFDKFHRVDHSLTRRQDGVGLGLSISRRLLRDLGGDLVYEARAGGGACFTIILPIQEDNDT